MNEIFRKEDDYIIEQVGNPFLAIILWSSIRLCGSKVKEAVRTLGEAARLYGKKGAHVVASTPFFNRCRFDILNR